MSDENTIRVAERIETDFGEKYALLSPFEAKDFIANLPWKSYAEEVEEHGSLEEKAVARDKDVPSSVFDAMEDFGFSDDFETHVSWEPDAVNGQGAWTIDVDALDEATEFFEFVGYDVEVESGVTTA